MVCDRCGNELRDTVQFCPTCGIRVQAPSGTTAGSRKAWLLRLDPRIAGLVRGPWRWPLLAGAVILLLAASLIPVQFRAAGDSRTGLDRDAAVSASQIQVAIAYAESFVGTSHDDQMSLQFVWEAWNAAGVNIGGRSAGVTPALYWSDDPQDWAHHPGSGAYNDPPAGALVFWDTYLSPSDGGHVALSLGGGRVVSTGAYPYANGSVTDPSLDVFTFSLTQRNPIQFDYLGYVMPLATLESGSPIAMPTPSASSSATPSPSGTATPSPPVTPTPTPRPSTPTPATVTRTPTPTPTPTPTTTPTSTSTTATGPTVTVSEGGTLMTEYCTNSACHAIDVTMTGFAANTRYIMWFSTDCANQSAACWSGRSEPENYASDDVVTNSSGDASIDSLAFGYAGADVWVNVGAEWPGGVQSNRISWSPA